MNKIKEVFLYVAISHDNVTDAMEAFAHYWPYVMGIPSNTLIPLTKGQERIFLCYKPEQAVEQTVELSPP